MVSLLLQGLENVSNPPFIRVLVAAAVLANFGVSSAVWDKKVDNMKTSLIRYAYSKSLGFFFFIKVLLKRIFFSFAFFFIVFDVYKT